tara:strand:- start:13 stop:630 length:618 start_codon:yes stop_codon:yes gene_type:complete
MTAATARFLLVDDFLPVADVTGLIAYSLEHSAAFEPAKIRYMGQRDVDYGSRQALKCTDGLGRFEAIFTQALAARQDDLMKQLRLPSFEVSRTEIELAAYGDGGFFVPHIDTATGEGRSTRSDRMLTTVYYFHAAPKRFSGGELVIHSLRPGHPFDTIEPVHNRLVVFPSYIPHEVRPISCADDGFSSRRFSINLWLHRDRPATG